MDWPDLNALKHVVSSMNADRRDRLLTHVRCINADKPGLREGYCYKVLRRMRNGDVIIINSNGDERAYGPKRFARVTEARAVVINELWLERYARQQFYMMSGELLWGRVRRARH